MGRIERQKKWDAGVGINARRRNGSVTVFCN
jgi:hypothetical protein